MECHQGFDHCSHEEAKLLGTSRRFLACPSSMVTTMPALLLSWLSADYWRTSVLEVLLEGLWPVLFSCHYSANRLTFMNFGEWYFLGRKHTKFIKFQGSFVVRKWVFIRFLTTLHHLLPLRRDGMTGRDGPGGRKERKMSDLSEGTAEDRGGFWLGAALRPLALGPWRGWYGQGFWGGKDEPQELEFVVFFFWGGGLEWMHLIGF